jgi:hypothetical protein
VSVDSARIQCIQQERDELDAELSQLHQANGDLILQVQLKDEELAKKREEVKVLMEQLEASAGSRLNQSNPAAILNRLRKERKNSKADSRDVEVILELIQAITL